MKSPVSDAARRTAWEGAKRDLICQRSASESAIREPPAHFTLTTSTPIDQHSAHPASARPGPAGARPPYARGRQDLEPASVTLFDLQPPQPSGVVAFGFSEKQTGGHMARSMMLSELTELLAAVTAGATVADYRRAIVDENALGKPTSSSREKSFRHLVELYTLNAGAALFRVMRQLAQEDPPSLPLLAATLAVCRDPQLRHSFELVRTMAPAEVLVRERMEAHLELGFPGRFSPAMKKSLAQNVNTTWTAAGHLKGTVVKRRAFPEPRMAASTFAVFAGYLLGLRGQALVESEFGRLVGADATVLTRHLSSASGRGWVRFRHAGGVFEVDFSPLLTPEEQGVLHGAH